MRENRNPLINCTQNIRFTNSKGITGVAESIDCTGLSIL